MKAAPSGSGRNSYVSSNYSNFLSQNSRRKFRHGARRLAEKGIAGYAHSAAICGRVGRPRHPSTPLFLLPFPPSCPTPDHPFRSTLSSGGSTLLSRVRGGGREKPTRKFREFRFSHSRNLTLRNARSNARGLKVASGTSMRLRLREPCRRHWTTHGERTGFLVLKR